MTKSTSKESILKRLNELRARHACTIELADAGRVKAVRPSESGKSKKDYATIDEINSFIKKHGLILDEDSHVDGRRRYRRPEDRPDPEQASNAEVNRLRKNFQARVLWDLAEEVDDAIKASGKTRQQWVEEALREKLERDR